MSAVQFLDCWEIEIAELSSTQIYILYFIWAQLNKISSWIC